MNGYCEIAVKVELQHACDRLCNSWLIASHTRPFIVCDFYHTKSN